MHVTERIPPSFGEQVTILLHHVIPPSLQQRAVDRRTEIGERPLKNAPPPAFLVPGGGERLPSWEVAREHPRHFTTAVEPEVERMIRRHSVSRNLHRPRGAEVILPPPEQFQRQLRPSFLSAHRERPHHAL